MQFYQVLALNLPGPIAAYFSADKGNAEMVSHCFTEDALVKDEGQTYEGRAAIKRGKANASGKYQYTSKPFAFEEKEGKTVVISPETFLGAP